MKLFNRERRALLKKYSLYAIGEILLVVIGILIAVSINNANENRKARAERQQLARAVHSQMILDSLNVHKVLLAQDGYNPIFNKVLRETGPDEPITDCGRCASLIISDFTITVMDAKVAAILEDAELVEDSLSWLLKKIEADYKNSKTIIDLLEESLVDNLKENVQYLRDTQPWFAQFSGNRNCNADCQEYFAMSTDFRNRVAYREILTRYAYTTELTGFLTKIRDHLTDLSKFVQAEDKQESDHEI